MKKPLKILLAGLWVALMLAFVWWALRNLPGIGG
jgi:hypothetical protein